MPHHHHAPVTDGTAGIVARRRRRGVREIALESRAQSHVLFLSPLISAKGRCMTPTATTTDAFLAASLPVQRRAGSGETLDGTLQGFSASFAGVWLPLPRNISPGLPATRVFSSNVFRQGRRTSLRAAGSAGTQLGCLSGAPKVGRAKRRLRSDDAEAGAPGLAIDNNRSYYPLWRKAVVQSVGLSVGFVAGVRRRVALFSRSDLIRGRGLPRPSRHSMSMSATEWRAHGHEHERPTRRRLRRLSWRAPGHEHGRPYGEGTFASRGALQAIVADAAVQEILRTAGIDIEAGRPQAMRLVMADPERSGIDLMDRIGFRPQ